MLKGKKSFLNAYLIGGVISLMKLITFIFFKENNFKSNKGYPTKEHIAAIDKYGIIKEHRKSFGPVKDYLDRNR